MAQTSNLKLNLVTGADYVNPDTAFVNNFKLIDPLGLDYITAEGNSGNWWWRQWKGGRMEMGIDSQTFTTFTLVPWATSGLYISGDLEFPAYAMPFSSEPLAIVTYRKETGSKRGGIVHTIGSHSDPLTRPPVFRMVDAVQQTYTNPKFGIYVTGRYK